MSDNNSILVIGHPDSGKTVFLAQFLTRIRKRKSSIKLYKTPEKITAIADAIDSLAAGEEPQPTPADENAELILPIEIDEKRFDLTCPDYGGEQVNNLTGFMEIDETWQKLASEGNSWILFIRSSKISVAYDLSISSYEDIQSEKSSKFSNPGLSMQSRLIELLQALLYVRGVGIKNPIERPKLVVVLSCWDEIQSDQKPREILQTILPMFLHFVDALWQPNALKILGLSAQEFPLDTPEAKDRYQDELAENFGYIVLENGEKDKDITKLIKLALE